MSNSSDWERDEIKVPHRPGRGRERDTKPTETVHCRITRETVKAESPQDLDFVYLFAYGANKSLLLATPAFLVHRLIEPCYTHVPPGSPAIEGSEDGRDGRAASVRERGIPWLRQLLMHLWEKRYRSRARLWAAPRSEKPIIQLRGFGTGRSLLTSSPILTAARASIAVSSESGAAVASFPTMMRPHTWMR